MTPTVRPIVAAKTKNRPRASVAVILRHQRLDHDPEDELPDDQQPPRLATVSIRLAFVATTTETPAVTARPANIQPNDWIRNVFDELWRRADTEL